MEYGDDWLDYGKGFKGVNDKPARATTNMGADTHDVTTVLFTP